VTWTPSAHVEAGAIRQRVALGKAFEALTSPWHVACREEDDFRDVIRDVCVRACGFFYLFRASKILVASF
jgi:hypothetical protein